MWKTFLEYFTYEAGYKTDTISSTDGWTDTDMVKRTHVINQHFRNVCNQSIQ